ncbi:hypothetical protein Tsubulata_032063 [Turnera subulata]|uniref:Uncharacterized protein n=1 Tax=Turnera subulata TaxID=218843 RepID=A0A9Q0J4T4_9ROSI|nr:hypothetical protein Tsubulata_032063 [Turnera subulata]
MMEQKVRDTGSLDLYDLEFLTATKMNMAILANPSTIQVLESRCMIYLDNSPVGEVIVDQLQVVKFVKANKVKATQSSAVRQSEGVEERADVTQVLNHGIRHIGVVYREHLKRGPADGRFIKSPETTSPKAKRSAGKAVGGEDFWNRIKIGVIERFTIGS